jgi:hypothetical protein
VAGLVIYQSSEEVQQTLEKPILKKSQKRKLK